MEYLKRKKQMEAKELEALRKNIDSQDIKFSLYSDILKILRNKILIAFFLGATSLVAYQFFSFSEKIRDPITNKNKIVFLKYSYGISLYLHYVYSYQEKKLAKAVEEILKQNYTFLAKTSAIQKKSEELYKQVQDNPNLKVIERVLQTIQLLY